MLVLMLVLMRCSCGAHARAHARAHAVLMRCHARHLVLQETYEETRVKKDDWAEFLQEVGLARTSQKGQALPSTSLCNVGVGFGQGANAGRLAGDLAVVAPGGLGGRTGLWLYTELLGVMVALGGAW